MAHERPNSPANYRVHDLGKQDADYWTQVALGQVHGQHFEIKFGENAGVGTVDEDVWQYGGKYSWQTVAEQLDVLSASADDTNQGIGAWSVRIFGLDENWLEIQEDILLDGVTPVRTTLSYLRVNRMFTLQSGTREGQDGAIFARRSSDGTTVQAAIYPDYNQTQQAIYTVPAGLVAVIVGVTTSVGNGDAASVKYWTFDNSYPNASKRVRRTIQLVESIESTSFKLPYVMDEKTDLWVSAQKTGVGATVDVDAEFSFVLIHKAHVPIFQPGYDPHTN